MRVVIFALMSVLCLVGMTAAQYGYGGYGQVSGGSGMWGIGALVFLFFLLILFNRTRSVPLYFQNQSLGVNVQTGILG